MKDTWNILDFSIVLISLSEFALGDGVSVLKLLRTVRALRPLKLVTTNQQLKIAVQSLFMSIKDISNALIISFMFYLIFSIVFVNFFKGRMHLCNYADPDAALKEYENEL